MLRNIQFIKGINENVFFRENPKLPTATPVHVAATPYAPGCCLYRRARCCLFPKSPLVAVRGHCLAGAAASARSQRLCAWQPPLLRVGATSAHDSHYLYWRAVVACEPTACGQAHDRRLCVAAVGAWRPPKCGLCLKLLLPHSRDLLFTCNCCARPPLVAQLLSLCSSVVDAALVSIDVLQPLSIMKQ
ncbi:hypothetical protein GW17_00025092 [Ensete ventricosum]|nr:hypothetical protein GW17_00025092 [Ensete ventricosum]